MSRTPLFAPLALLGALLLASAFAPLTRSFARQQQTQQQTQPQPSPVSSPATSTARQQSPPPSPSPQQSSSSPSPQTQPTPPVETAEEDVVQITTNIVQLDAVVTDKHGNQVTDLKPEDFQIFEDGKPRKITHFSYVQTMNAAAPTVATKPDKNAPPAPPVPPRKLRPEQVRRAVALVVDDLQLSFSDLVFARRAVREYVDKYVAPDDLVAIVRTSAGVGALQQFTNDRRILYAAIERIKPYHAGSGGLSTFAPIESSHAGSMGATDMGSNTSNNGSSSDSSGSNANDQLENFRQDYFTVGTLGALNYVVNGMSELPGRKTIVLFSPGFTLHNPDDPLRSDRALIAARRLVDLASRASVVIYGVDPRGLVYTGLTAADDASDMSSQQITDVMTQRNQQLTNTQEGLQYLAEQTGGFAVKNSNNLLPARRILEDQKGYYLIAYRPESQTFDRRFHRLSAKLVNHHDLTLRTREGFYGVSNEQMRPAKRTRDQQFFASLMSPIAAGDVHLSLTAVFTNTARTGSILSALLHVEARDLKFEKQADGKYSARLDLVGVTFSDSGLVVDQHGITQTLKLSEETYQRFQREGFVYTINVPVKKPGAYQLRIALRDDATDRIGSASQFVEVPDLKKDRLALSGIIMSSAQDATTMTTPAANAATKPADASATTGAAQSVGQSEEGAVASSDPRASAAIRRFRQRAVIDFGCVIFNARTDKTHPQPQVTAQTRLFRDGQPVFEGREQPLKFTLQTDLKRIPFGSRLSLGTNLPPGDYVLQIIATDTLADPKHRTASQWIDFEIVK
jgi:VWFA-related protein